MNERGGSATFGLYTRRRGRRGGGGGSPGGDSWETETRTRRGGECGEKKIIRQNLQDLRHFALAGLAEPTTFLLRETWTSLVCCTFSIHTPTSIRNSQLAVLIHPLGVIKNESAALSGRDWTVRWQQWGSCARAYFGYWRYAAGWGYATGRRRHL